MFVRYKRIFKEGERGDYYTPDDVVDPASIEPLHRVKDSRLLAELSGNMLENGWSGRPLLVLNGGNGNHLAWTGSHRWAAAYKTNTPIPVIFIDNKGWSDSALEDYNDIRDDDDRLRWIETHQSYNQDAIRLMHQEIEESEI